ncbi:hypothetical protein [Actinokineospora sp. HUAS TT18]|uniref:hypothetical protein n=1 Tax=Actinokineospora sp. HUAS TT18 TaxID=3447451 RepID=UPI003F5217C3
MSTDPTRIIGFDLPNVMGTVAANDEVQLRRATRVIAACALLLAMIGLNAAEGVTHQDGHAH